MKRSFFGQLVSLIAAGCSPLLCAADVRYTVTDLGTLGGSYSAAQAINDAGLIAGTSTHSDGSYHGFYWSGGQMTILGGVSSAAHGITSAGTVAGNWHSFQWSNGVNHACLWSGQALANGLGVLPGGTSSYANGINDNGQVAGDAEVHSYGTSHAFLWTSADGMRNLGTLGGSFAHGNAINNSGEVAGTSGTSNSNSFIYHAFLWTAAGGMRDLGTLGGTISKGNAVNNAGEVAGTASNGMASHAFLWNAATGMADLGTPPGNVGSEALGVNDGGDVVGYAWGFANNVQHAFVSDGLAMQDLNGLIDPSSGWTLNQAADINNLGQIVGSGTIDGQTHAFLLTAVPEPAGLSLIALAISGTLVRGRRR